MADLTSQYKDSIDAFQQNAFELLVFFVAVCALFGLLAWVADKLDNWERTYRKKNNIRGPRDE